MHRFRKCWPSHDKGQNAEANTDISAKQRDTLRNNDQKTISVSSSDTILSHSATEAEEKFLFDEFRGSALPAAHSQLQLHAAGESFKLHQDIALPELKQNEVLVQVQTVGLNPIDWKAPAFGWGLPSLPCTLGRDFVGTVVRNADSYSSLKVGSVVGAISTDYRDYRKAAFQEYAVASQHNVYRIPEHYQNSQRNVASLGVAFVTAAIAFGVCLGGTIEGSKGEIVDLLSIARGLSSEDLPEDVRDECANSRLSDNDRPKQGDWIVIWGAGSTVGFVLVQLAKLAGLKVIAVADAIKSGSLLVDAGADVIVHRNNHEEAVRIIAGITKGKELRYGIDTVGKETSRLVQSSLHGEATRTKHIVGLVGLPKPESEEVHQHKVPIKLFHEAIAVGVALTRSLEGLLRDKRLMLPIVHIHQDHGLGGVNSGLQLLRSGDFEGQRIVVPI